MRVSTDPADPIQDTETVEAAEARVASQYENALKMVALKQLEPAKDALQRLLQEPLLTGQVASGNLTMMRQLRFVALKNLAALLAAEDADPSRARALDLYTEAANLDGGDLLLWNKLGLLVRSGPVLRYDACRPCAVSSDEHSRRTSTCTSTH